MCPIRALSAEPRLTGENPFIVLKTSESGPELTNVSFWRILYSPHGAGHAAFIKCDLSGKDNPKDKTLAIYSDNEALVRWLQKEIQTMVPELRDPKFPVRKSTFSRSGDTKAAWTEQIRSGKTTVSLTWGKLDKPFFLEVEGEPGIRHIVRSFFIPSMDASLAMNGVRAVGRAFRSELAGRKASTCCLAFSESWLLPKEA
ncbi:MAG: hypothetical protein EXR48_04160 [Dehalococcoidia bacterium]|nr:hypothetical protein [Dehalococcoidia bacterium]